MIYMANTGVALKEVIFAWNKRHVDKNLLHSNNEILQQ